MPKINKYIFRGYDIRGVSGKDLNPEIVEHLGKAYGAYIIKHKIDKKIIIARDCRATSPEYSQAMIKGLTSVGIDVIDIGLNLVGTFYWAQYYFNAKGGVMVTASHNPAEYNGFKFATNFSQTMVAEETQEIRTIYESGNFAVAAKMGVVKNEDIKKVYFDDLIKRFNIKKGLRVVVDAGYATAGAVIPDLLRKVGCEVVENYCELDSTFPLGAPDPTEKEIIERLGKKVIEAKADIGFTYDADGDRIGIVDEKGNTIWNDVLVALFAVDVLDHHPRSTIMYNTLCSKVVEDTIKDKGGTPFMWRTGHGFLKRKNEEIKAAFIGELSGHFFFSADFYNHDDGAYSSLRLLDYLSRTNQTLSEAVAKLPKYISSPEVKIGCADDKKVALIKKMGVVARDDFPQAEVIDDERAGDGIRVNIKDSMFVIRYSQNGPYLTIKFEAKDKKTYEQRKNYLNNLLKQYKEVDWSYGVNLDSLK